jgi:hypothetical protein
MKRQKSVTARRIAFTLLMVAMFLAAVLAGPAAAEHQVPFKGSLEGGFTITPLDPPLAVVRIEAAGNATHLGQFTLEFPHVVSFATTSAAEGSYEFTAANGDTLTADLVTGEATPTENTDELSIVETATITGGTGRFDGATGGFTVVRLARLADLAAGFTSGSFEGTISSPGAGKP